MEDSRMVSVTILLILIVSCFGLAQEEEHEKRVRLSDLPSAVQSTIAREGKGLHIRGLSEEVEDGQILYEAEFTIPGGRNQSLLINREGSVVEVEEWISKYAVPAAVLQGLQGQAGRGKITKIETITKMGKLVAYEATVMTDGKKSEVQVGPGGNPLLHQE